MAHALKCDGHDATAQFAENFDKFFDCLNVSSLTGGKKKRKQYRYPYRTGDDDRLEVSFKLNIPSLSVLLGQVTFHLY